MQCEDILVRRMTLKTKTYNELITFQSFTERLEYLYIGDKVGRETFGNARRINQILYTSYKWRKKRNEIILRDLGCDLGIDGCDLSTKNIIVHHINPITEQDIIDCNYCVFANDNLICTSLGSHNYIHYGTKIQNNYVERRYNDTSPWRR